jgi:hypothetical protein
MSRKKDTYEQIYDNEPFTVGDGERWNLACCHCGLVHAVKIESQPNSDELKITLRQNLSRTARRRRDVPDLVCKPVKGSKAKRPKR